MDSEQRSQQHELEAPEKREDQELLLEELGQFHPADAADHLENLEEDDQRRMLQEMPLEDAAAAVGEMTEYARAPLLMSLEPSLVADIAEAMAPDDAADMLDELDEDFRNKVFKELEKEDRVALTRLMRFAPDTAGGIMNTEILVLDHGLTVDQGINLVRKNIQDTEIPYYAYLVNEQERLIGVLSLRNLLLAPKGTLLKNLADDQNLVTVQFDVDREEVAHQMRHYNFPALPVVDYMGRLLGVVTHDDVMDIMTEEASEDMLGMVGAGVDETVDTPWRSSVLKRLPWLFINLMNSALAAYVVHMFEGAITQMAILAALMPIVANQAGNTGQQSLAVMIRQLAVERVQRKRAWGAVLREAKIGLANGLLVGIAVFCLAFGFMHNIDLASVLGIALGLDMFLGAVAGASIPLILKELGRDPAQASSIFLTTLTDTTGFLTFLGLASLMLF